MPGEEATGHPDCRTCTSIPVAVSRAKRRRVNASAESSEKNSKGDLFTAAVKSELLLYENKSETSSNESVYKPASSTILTKDHLRTAALEFVKRGEEEPNLAGPSLVSRNVSKSPSLEFEREALAGTGIAKLWYALTKEKDLLIIKISSGDTHSKSVARLILDLGAFSDQYDGIFDVDSDGDHVLISGTTIAPDTLLQRSYPNQPPTNPQLRSPLVVELEIGNRGPKGLMEQLGTYLQQPESDYALGIKIYKRSGPAVTNGKRPFAALAALWRRANIPAGQPAQFVGVWSFGTGALHRNSASAFTTTRGNLAPIPEISHPSPSDNIVIPATQLIQGAVDIHGDPVPLLVGGNDLVVRLDKIRDICDRRLAL